MREYLRGLALRVAADRSAAGLLACNVVALAITVFHPPVTMSVMFLYWAECAIVGLLNFIKLYYIPDSIAKEDEAEWERMSPGKKLAYRSVPRGFFLLHYGGFLYMVFTMLYLLGEREIRGRGAPGYDVLGHLAGFWLPVLVIGAGHVASFFRNFLGKREYQGRSFEDQMFRPYKRVLLMLVVVFGGCAMVIVTGLPEMALLVLVPFKIIADLEAHFREHTA